MRIGGPGHQEALDDDCFKLALFDQVAAGKKVVAAALVGEPFIFCEIRQSSLRLSISSGSRYSIQPQSVFSRRGSN